MKAEINGITLNYQLEGREGAPWLVFSNSLATDLSMWDVEASHYADRYRILRYDTRGHGKSTASPAPYDLELLVSDAEKLLAQVGAVQPIFVGLSLGGMTALGLALKNPAPIRAIAVCAARADAPEGFGALWDERIAIARSKGMSALVEATVSRWFTADLLAAKPPFLPGVVRMIEETPVEGYVGCASSLKGLDYFRHLDRIKLPAIFIAGANDAAAPSAHMRAMSEKVAGARFVELSPAGHLVNLQQPEAFRAALDEFFDSLGG